MVRVKICGITNIADARHAVACGADALGFVFYEKSPRHVAVDVAADIIAGLPPLVSCVGLFVNAARSIVEATVSACGLDVIQLHGDELPEECHFGRRKTIKALRLRDAGALAEAERFRDQTLLLDAYVPSVYGGTGATGDWGLACRIAASRPVILAGGLTPENVTAAISAVGPYAVDVSSGVEASPGRKDPNKVARFIQLAKESVA